MLSFEPMQRLFNELRRRNHLRWEILSSPRAFRRQLVLSPDDTGPLESRLLPWQVADFEAMDPAWMALAGRPVVHAASGHEVDFTASTTSLQTDGNAYTAYMHAGSVHYQRAYIERARGHSKTSDMAAQIAWILLAARKMVVGLAAAADRDQARLIHRAVRRLAAANPWLCGDLQFVENIVRHRKTTSSLEVISSDVRGSWGALPDFVICDELCHWRSPDLWHSLLSSAAKKPDCVLAVLTNAGLGRGWQWDVREHARRDPRWYFSALDGPVAPWITDEQLEEQKAMLPPAVFARLWLNEWQHSDGEFVTLAEAEACRDAELCCQQAGHSQTRYVAAIDYAEKHDLTVGCVCHQAGSRIVVDRMDVASPTPGRPTLVKWVDDWIQQIAATFFRTTFVLDPHQLVGTIQRLERRHDIQRFDFAAGAGNHRLAIHLRHLITHGHLAWYPGCGAIHPHNSPRDDLETELASLLLRESDVGRLRIDHHRDGVHHDDRAFALGVACLHLAENPDTGLEPFSITPPISDRFVW